MPETVSISVTTLAIICGASGFIVGAIVGAFIMAKLLVSVGKWANERETS